MEEPHINDILLTFLLNFHVKARSLISGSLHIPPPLFFLKIILRQLQKSFVEERHI